MARLQAERVAMQAQHETAALEREEARNASRVELEEETNRRLVARLQAERALTALEERSLVRPPVPSRSINQSEDSSRVVAHARRQSVHGRKRSLNEASSSSSTGANFGDE